MANYRETSANLRFILPLSFLNLTVFLASCSVAYKLVVFGPAIVPGPPCIFPLSYLISDIIAEVYGIKMAKKIIWLTLIFELVFAFLVYFVIKLPSPAFFHLQHSYNDVFSNVIRFTVSGAVSVIISSFINVHMITKFKVILKGRYFWLRSIFSSIIGEMVLTLLIILLAYSFEITFHTGLVMFASINGIELLVSLLLVWPASILVHIIKKIEHTDEQVLFNPFKNQQEKTP